MRPRLSSGRRLVVSTAAAGLLAVIVVAFAAGTHGVGGLRVARVRGTSMNPTFQAGDLVLVRRRRRYDVGEIVAYRRSGGELVIHRVAAKAGDELRLKGDNNPAADPDWVAVKDIIGHEVLHAPHGLPWLSVAVLALAATALATAWSPRLRQRP